MRRSILLCSFLALSGCANDKTLRFVAGAAASKFTASKTQNALNGCAAAISAGIAKELYDNRFGGVVDAADAVATGAGCMYTLRF